MLLENLYKYSKPTAAEKVMLYVLEHLDDNFIFSRTYDRIQQDTGVSQPTIARTFKVLEETGAAKHICKSQWDLSGIAVCWAKKPSDMKSFYVVDKGS